MTECHPLEIRHRSYFLLIGSVKFYVMKRLKYELWGSL